MLGFDTKFGILGSRGGNDGTEAPGPGRRLMGTGPPSTPTSFRVGGYFGTAQKV